MHIPVSTYRLQLHSGFTFAHLQRIIDYLETLGVTTLYVSPIMQATPGSMHGYDVTDPATINKELGTEEALRSMIHELRKKSMYWLQDIVPNHMAFHTANLRLMDVLERGPVSPYYNFFDIDWNHPDDTLKGKVMVPFLGDALNACITRGEIRLTCGETGFTLNYFDTAWPVSLSAYPGLTDYLRENTADKTLSSTLTKMTAAASGAGLDDWRAHKQSFMEAVWPSPEIRAALDAINNDQIQLQRICDQQYYRLCFWKEADRHINYRRFFTVNELICLRMEDKSVFDTYHAYLHKLYKEKLIQGFRIDHIDGLQDPGQYIQELRQLMGSACYIIAEKILEAKEDLPAEWALQGTSGYEFLSILSQLLTYRKGAKELLEYYQQLIPWVPPYKKLIRKSKELILHNYISGEWDNLTHLLRSLGLAGDFPDARIKQALGNFMLALPVYRIYPEHVPLKGKNLEVAHEAFDKAIAADPEYQNELNHLRRLFTEAGDEDDAIKARVLLFMKRLMQFTGPLTAKGVEDTTFYIYNPLISHDEVGDSPATLGMTVQRFHEKMQKRLASTPLSLNATATHDTKRGEDARVRINVLSRIAERWKQQVNDWIRINRPLHEEINGRDVPALNDEYFIYQSMVGGFPEDFRVTQEWMERVQAYLNKALREAKVNTSWSEPDAQYEAGCARFMERILSENHGFLDSFTSFMKTVCAYAMVDSLSQTLIKLTAPGIPDIYQGCELWDLSFVDPDNRRPVDYDKRMEFLFQLVIRAEKGWDAVSEYLREHRAAGVEKLYITWKILNMRKVHAALFTEGSYLPLTVTGEETSAAAYARNLGTEWVIVAFPFDSRKYETPAGTESDEQYVVLPEDAPQSWRNVLTGAQVESVNQIPLSELFRSFPVALLIAETTVV